MNSLELNYCTELQISLFNYTLKIEMFQLFKSFFSSLCSGGCIALYSILWRIPFLERTLGMGSEVKLCLCLCGVVELRGSVINSICY